jgi:prevent-host-death family protein
MTTTTLSSREFNQDSGRAKKAASAGPVIITDRGRPAHVLLSIDEYRRITGEARKITDLLHFAGAAEADLPIGRDRDLARPADLS